MTEPQAKKPPKCRIALVGEAWGIDEEKAEHPFVGSSGRELARMIAEAGMAPRLRQKYPNLHEMVMHWKWLREEFGIFLFNVYNGHPPRNDFETMFLVPKGEADYNLCQVPVLNGKYFGTRIAPHIINIRDEISLWKPNITVCLGNIASAALTGEARITVVRGNVTTSPYIPSIKVLPTYHPAAILRQWSWRPVLVADLIKANRQADFPEVRRQERWLTIRPSLKEIADWFAVPADYNSVDIESGQILYTKDELRHMTPRQRNLLAQAISMIGFARSPHEAIVIRLMDRDKPGLNFWEFPSHEVKCMELMREHLAKPIPKIFQNGMYDINMMLTHGLVTLRAVHDTMLFHHSAFPELPKALGFLGSIYADEIAWKTMYGSGESLKKDD